ncbi:MAG: ribonucleoside triphosphate reductase [Candidatus Woesearchaeota archaeon]
MKNEFIELVDGYLSENDWRVKENSNVKYSFSGLLLHAAGSVLANYTLSLYPEHIAKKHKNGDFHIHDLSMGIAGYCAGWSLKQLLLEGFNGVPGKVESAAPKHFATALGQIINFLGTLQNEWAGAMAFSSFDTYLAPFVRNDELDYTQIKQLIQQFVFNLNVSSRWGGQTPFTNLTLDWTVPEDMKDEKVILGGEYRDSTYKDYQKEMDLINRAFLEVMIEGDHKGRIFTFPIPTYNITKTFNWDNENAQKLFEMTAKYGTPYFQNFVTSDLKPTDVRSMCCRLQMDLRELRNKSGGLFGSGESTGSVGVVTINLPRIGYCAQTEEEFFTILASHMDDAYESLELKRRIVEDFMEKGLFPYTKRYLGSLKNHFSTIGLNGMNEALMNFFEKDVTIVSEKGRAFALKILDFMRERIQGYQEKSHNIYNLEATPAEGTAYRFARMDRQRYPDILAQGTSDPYYTNSSQLPVDFTNDIFEALDLQAELQSKYTGGTVFHGFIGEQIKDVEVCKKLVKKIAYNYKLPYYTITPTFSICPVHGYIAGEHHICPKCIQEKEQAEVKQ